MANIFVNATQARANSRNNSVIHAEIRSIESAILGNIDAGVLYANVSSGTDMTSSNVYYKVYYGLSTDATKSDQLNYVEQYFKDKGYGVIIKEAPGNTQTLTWNISW